MSKAKFVLLVVSLFCLPAKGQDAQIGIAMPITLRADAIVTKRLRTFAPNDSNFLPGFRATFYPSLKLGPRWFAYAAIQVNSYPLFFYQTYYPSRGIDTSLVSAFVGYAQKWENKALSVKAGKLTSAFGAFPLQYDDTVNPLLDVPLDYYGLFIGLRPDQIPCGVADMQRLSSIRRVTYRCGGSSLVRGGMWTVTMYGLPAAQADFSFHNLDMRLQLTNSSPSNSQTLVSDHQNVQWTAGAGYTIRQGFRVGFSAFRGPFLEDSVIASLPRGKSIRDYPATGFGIDGHWASGRWSTDAEWAWFQFQYPNLLTHPVVSSGHFEAKAILSPRFYTAVRASFLRFNRVADAQRRSAQTFQPNQEAYEFALGFHVNHFQLMKVGYEWLRMARTPLGSRENVFAVQYITSIDALSKAIR